MALFNRSYTTFYWSAIVSIANAVPFSSYLPLNNRDLGLEVTEGNSNWCHSKAWARFPIRLP